jgi:membrane AbrB-like protein
LPEAGAGRQPAGWRERANRLAALALALGAGAAGALAAGAVGMPAPLITGPSVFVAIAGLAGLRFSLPDVLRDLAFVVLGLVIGAGVTPQALAAARQWPASFALLSVAVVAIMLASGAGLARWHGFDRASGLLAAAPGHLSYVLALAAATGRDVPRIAMVQSIRLLALTLLVPLAVSASIGAPPTQVAAPDLATPPLLALAGAGALAGLALGRLSMPAAMLVGAMAISAIAHATATVAGAIPAWFSVPALALLGVLIGSRFSGVTIGELRRCAAAGLFATALAAALSVVFAIAAALATGLPVSLLLVCFAPGGLETMTAIALVTGADPAMVAAHHVFRMILLTLLLPAMLAATKDAPGEH